MRIAQASVFLMTFVYVLMYVPYMFLTRWLSTVTLHGLDRPLSGLETLPPIVLVGSVMLAIFVWASGWWRSAHLTKVFGVTFPIPTMWTALSGVGTSMLLITVPLSLTFEDVSIPFMQLVMRGDVLILAPAIDLLFGRRVRWFSWVALGLVGIALVITLWGRGGFDLPPLAIVTIAIYTLGYCIRLAVMTKVAKDEDPESLKRYFVEEKIVAIPLGLVLLWLLSLSPFAQSAGVEVGVLEIWIAETIWPLLGMAFCWFVIAIASAIILLGPQENSFCVPLERSGSILAGTLAAYGLAIFSGQEAPTAAENIGTVLLVAAIAFLSFGPRFKSRPSATPAEAV